ncbi:hypothetical protein PENSPDRAFT_659041 [Peniophora sp. CONT]|nr:hypothetical protein PENSPDRAFT_659041 [Peniophora sp. CONT]
MDAVLWQQRGSSLAFILWLPSKSLPPVSQDFFLTLILTVDARKSDLIPILCPHSSTMAITKRPIPKRLVLPVKPSVLVHTTKPTKVYNLRKQRWTWIPASAPAPREVLDLADAFDAMSLEPSTSRPKASHLNDHNLLPELDSDFIAGLESVFGSPSWKKRQDSASSVSSTAPVNASTRELEDNLRSMTL